MARRYSRMLELGTPAPAFALADPAGRIHALEDHREAPALLVAFLCNHCPYVRHILPGFVDFAREYGSRGLAVVAINPNDATAYPDDAPAAMAEAAARHGFTFPYLHDESQAVALAYQAVCTPDFFLFDGNRRLVYRGQFDDSRPGNGRPVTGADLRAAIDATLAGQAPAAGQQPSLGCNIKWRKGNEPDYYAGG